VTITYRLVKGQALTAAEYDATVLDLDERPNGQVYPKASGVGVKIDTDAPDWGWHDLIGELQFEEGSPTAPGYVAFVGNIKEHQFNVNDEAFVNLHMPHDYAPGTDIFIHVHWSHNVLGLTTGAPSFVVEGTYSKGHNQAAFGTPASVTLTENASTTRYQHMVTEAQFSNAGGTAGLLDSMDLEADGVFLLRLSMLSNTMDGGALPFVHYVDVHYQSTGVATKQKSPDFWT
jgi:hypothetical protein